LLIVKFGIGFSCSGVDVRFLRGEFAVVLIPDDHGLSAAEVYAQIETDLKEAIAVLPSAKTYTGSDIGRASKGAAKTLLAKMYLQRAGTLHLLTHDHSLAQYLLDNQMMAADDPRLSFARRQLLQHLGMATPPLPWMRKLTLAGGDRFLLCSDGLTDMVPDEGIAAVLRREPRVQAACAELVDLAKLAGGRDNVTVVLVDFEV